MHVKIDFLSLVGVLYLAYYQIYLFLGITRELQNLTAGTKADSESDIQDQTPDTDDSGAHSYPEVSTTASFGVSGTGSFKRTPVMGNKSLEQRGKKSKTYPLKESVPVVSFVQSYFSF